MRIAILLSLLLTLLAGPALGEEFTPDFERARLVVGDRTLAPVTVREPAPEGARVDDLRLVVQNETIVARREDGTPVWSHSWPEGRIPELVGVGEGVLFVFLWKKVDEEEYRRAEPTVVRRLRLQKGEPLPALRIPEAREGELARDLLVEGNETLVLSLAEEEAPPHSQDIRQYRVTSFDGAKVRWSKGFSASGRVGGPHALLLGGGGPSYAGPGVRPLSLVRDDIIVCAGGSEDILALDRKTGEERWKLPAVWEFERSFVGPSVWAYYLVRAVDRNEFPEDDEELKESKEEQSKRLRELRRIVAGPLVVPWDGGDGAWDSAPQDGYRLFVAVARDVNEYAGGYLSHAFVYEVNHKGSPIAVLPVPRMVRGGFRRGEEAIWLCEAGGIGATGPSFQKESHGMGDWGTDHVGRLAWWRQPAEFEVPKCWMRTGRTGDHLVVLKDRIYRVPAGGYILEKGERTFRLPITTLDLETGRQRDLLLGVPYSGDVPLPTGNFGHEIRADGSETWIVRGFHALAIDELHAEDGRLTATLRSASGRVADLAFEVD